MKIIIALLLINDEYTVIIIILITIIITLLRRALSMLKSGSVYILYFILGDITTFVLVLGSGNNFNLSGPMSREGTIDL